MLCIVMYSVLLCCPLFGLPVQCWIRFSPWGRSQPKMAFLGWWICGETLTEISLSWRKQKRSWAYQHAMVGCIISLPIMNIWCQSIILFVTCFEHWLYHLQVCIPIIYGLLAECRADFIVVENLLQFKFHCQVYILPFHSVMGPPLPIPPWSFQSQHPKLPRHAKARHCDAWAERPEMGCQARLTGRWLLCSQHVLAAGDWGGEQVLTVVLLRGINNIIHEKSRGVFQKWNQMKILLCHLNMKLSVVMCVVKFQTSSKSCCLTRILHLPWLEAGSCDRSR